jgi:superfamily II DNA/RNA helicase
VAFCATKRMVEEVAERLQARGFVAEALHGDISQAAREKVLRAFREGRSEVLVATDVAARGLDIPEVSLVVNFDLPPDPEYYVHRVGRTGRLGRRGEAITFVNPRELRELKVIERATGARIRRADVPTVAEIEARDLQVLEERLLDVLSRDAWGRYRAVVEDLLEEHDPEDVAAAALALVATTTRGGRASGRARGGASSESGPMPSEDGALERSRARPRRAREDRRPSGAARTTQVRPSGKHSARRAMSKPRGAQARSPAR